MDLVYKAVDAMEIISLTSNSTYNATLLFGFVFALFTISGSLFFNAGYGKFSDARFGIELDPRLGWFLMELPATLSFHYFYWSGPNAYKPLPLFCMFLFSKHYANRGWFFPLSLRVAKGAKQSFSISVVVIGIVFTTLHGYLNALWFSKFGTHLLNSSWVSSPWFLVGFPLYEFSYWATLHSEHIMRNLRDPKDTKGPRYKIPYGGGFNYVTNAHYFFELSAWFSWALMTRNPGGVIVFLVSSANLVPRAFTQHKWYLQKFDNYPKERKVLIPLVSTELVFV